MPPIMTASTRASRADVFKLMRALRDGREAGASRGTFRMHALMKGASGGSLDGVPSDCYSASRTPSPRSGRGGVSKHHDIDQSNGISNNATMLMILISGFTAGRAGS